MSATPAEVAKRWFGEVWNEQRVSIEGMTVRNGQIVEGWERLGFERPASPMRSHAEPTFAEVR